MREKILRTLHDRNWGVGVVTHVSYMGVCLSEGYGLQVVRSGKGYRNQPDSFGLE